MFLFFFSTGNTVRMANINTRFCYLCNISRRFGDYNVGRHDHVVRSNYPHGTLYWLFNDIVLRQIFCALAQQAYASVQ